MIRKLVENLVGPVGAALAGVALLAGWTMFHRMDAARAARAEVLAEYSQAAVEALERKAAKAEEITAAAEARAAAARAELQELGELKDEILDLPDDACVVPDDVLERLRRIR